VTAVAAALVLIALIGWFVGLQAVRVADDGSARPSRAVLVTNVVLCGAAAVLVLPRLYLVVT
jgi:hypothetical protein